MRTVSLPYGKTRIDLSLPDDRLKGVLVSKAHLYTAGRSEAEIVRYALEYPIDSPKLRDLSKGKRNIVVVTSDHTRPVPSSITLPLILEEIRRGNPDAGIKILIATGSHRPTTGDELVSKFGREVAERENFIIHKSTCREDMVEIGILPSGGKCEINRLAAEADLLVAEGFIEPHFFAGFSGGGKSILPGIASQECIMANHCSEFIASEFARTGILDNNPLQIDMLYAAEKANLAFILNVVIDAEHRIINAFAGHRETAHRAGCGFVGELAAVGAQPAEIVITTNGGYPLDQNIYQAVKGMTAAEATCKPGGVIIIAAECIDGHGGEGFYDWFKHSSGPEDVMQKIMRRKRNETIPDQWEAQVLSRILLKHKVIMVTHEKNRQVVNDMYMTFASSVDEALEIAGVTAGEGAGITVIPDGISVIVR